MKRYLQLNELLCLRHLADHGPCTLMQLFAASKQFPTLATSMIEDGLTYGYITDESPLYRIAITDEGRRRLSPRSARPWTPRRSRRRE